MYREQAILRAFCADSILYMMRQPIKSRATLMSSALRAGLQIQMESLLGRGVGVADIDGNREYNRRILAAKDGWAATKKMYNRLSSDNKALFRRMAAEYNRISLPLYKRVFTRPYYTQYDIMHGRKQYG